MRILVCGGRDFRDPFRTFDASLERIENRYGFDLLIEGGAPGADRMARLWAKKRGIPIQTYRADWQAHGRAAGPIRNRQMLEEGRPDLVVAFPGERGTADMVCQARAAGINVIVELK
jgi:hypothetical protein